MGPGWLTGGHVRLLWSSLGLILVPVVCFCVCVCEMGEKEGVSWTRG